MVVKSSNRRWFHPAVLLLPVLYVMLVAITAAHSKNPPGGAFYRIDGTNPFAAMFPMISDSATVIVSIQLLTGTPWWYLVGLTASSARNRVSAIGASAFSLFTFFVTILITIKVLKQDPDRSLLPLYARLQYGLIALLCLGALSNALYAIRNVVRSTAQTASN